MQQNVKTGATIIPCRRRRRPRSEQPLVGVGGEESGAGTGEGLVDVLHDDLRLADWLAVVNEHGDLLVDRIGGQQELALVLEVLLDVLIAQALEVEGKLHSKRERARHGAKQLQLVTGHFLITVGLDYF
jgi:hypothetical protein